MISMRSLVAIGALSLLTIGCKPAAPADPAKAASAERAAQSRTDPRLPAGFSIYLGDDGRARDFSVAAAADGQIVTFSIIAKPIDVARFYEAQAVAAGLQVTGRVDAGDLANVDAHVPRTGPQSAENGVQTRTKPRSFGAVAVNKGEFTNVSLSFDVTP